jgi:hypothetical protein
MDQFSRSRAKSRTRSRRGCGVALAKCEAIFRLQEPKKRARMGLTWVGVRNDHAVTVTLLRLSAVEQ